MWSVPFFTLGRGLSDSHSVLNNPASFKITFRNFPHLIGKPVGKVDFLHYNLSRFPSLNQNPPPQNKIFWKGWISPSPKFWDLVATLVRPQFILMCQRKTYWHIRDSYGNFIFNSLRLIDTSCTLVKQTNENVMVVGLKIMPCQHTCWLSTSVLL